MDYSDCNTTTSPFDEALSSPLITEKQPVKKKWSIISKPSSWFRRNNNKRSLPSSSSSIAMIPTDVVNDDCCSLSLESTSNDSFNDEEDLPLIDGSDSTPKSSLFGRKKSHHQRRLSFDTCTTFNSVINYGDDSTNNNGQQQQQRPSIVSRASSITSTASSIMSCTLTHPLQDLMEQDDDNDDDTNQETKSLLQRQNELVSFVSANDEEVGRTIDSDLAIMNERQTELQNVAGSMKQIRDIQLGTLLLAILLSILS